MCDEYNLYKYFTTGVLAFKLLPQDEKGKEILIEFIKNNVERCRADAYRYLFNNYYHYISVTEIRALLEYIPDYLPDAFIIFKTFSNVIRDKTIDMY